MSEPGFREIQLSTKQVVFLFIAGVAAFVAVFLLGVSVGRGVTADRAQTEAAAADPAADIKSTGVMPPATSPKPDELKYHDVLQGKGDKPAASAPPTPPDAPPDPTPTPTATPTPVVPPVTKAANSPKPATTPAPAPAKPAVQTTPAPGAGYFVQVDSFGSRDNAVRQQSQLKARGITAYIFDTGGPGVRYRVRVGPFADRAAADVMSARLRKEGFRPSVSR
jgi:DedD protein